MVWLVPHRQLRLQLQLLPRCMTLIPTTFRGRVFVQALRACSYETTNANAQVRELRLSPHVETKLCDITATFLQ